MSLPDCSEQPRKRQVNRHFVTGWLWPVILCQEVLLSPLLQLEGWLQEEDSRADWLPQDQKGP